MINWAKSSPVPEHVKIYLGWVIDTHALEIRATKEKLHKLKRSIRYTLRKQEVSARQLARVAGQCIAISAAIIPGRMMLRGVYQLLATRQSWESRIKLDSAATRDLEWWLAGMANWNGRPIQKRSIDLQMFTDASSIGWGAVLDGAEASGVWTPHLANRPSNIREMMAVLLALLTFRNELQNKTVQIVSDNVSTVANMNYFGGPTYELTRIARAVWNLATRLKISLQARHLKESLNCQADRLSRTPDRYNWMLNPDVFCVIDRMFGPHTVDRFASIQNAQVQRYNSRFWDPLSEGIDALAQSNWGKENNFCNPPWRLIPQILHTIREQRAEATLIAPVWRCQPWFAMLRRMLVA